MKEYLKHAIEFLNAHADELDALWTANNYWWYYKFCGQNNMELHSGMTRFVMCAKDFVVKIDNRHRMSRYSKFGGCYTEYKNWQMVQDDGMGYLFAAVNRIKAGHHFYYVMPVIKSIEDECSDLWDTDLVTEEESEYLMDNFCDLHCGNYGVDDEGNIKIFDYSLTCEYFARYHGRF